MRDIRVATLSLIVVALFPSVSHAQGSAGVPVFKVIQEGSSVKFHVDASVAIDGTFDKWTAGITMTSPEVSTACWT